MFNRRSIFDKFSLINMPFVTLIVILAMIGCAMLYSASGGDWQPWALPQLIRFCLCFVMMLILAMIDIRHIFSYSYIAYFVVLILLVYVEIAGVVGMGAQRWINLGFMHLQPSELMKIAIILALARFFHGLEWDDLRRLESLVIPLVMIMAPVVLVLLQPNLGTAFIITCLGIGLMFLAGLPLWYFILAAAAFLGSLPVVWYALHDYQKQRVLTFLDPEKDPLGTGYNILQSKIALGSGGIFGRGYLEGTQGHLQFLPEKHTDFIFTMFAEEFGLVGGVILLMLLAVVMLYSTVVSLNNMNQYARLVGLGVTLNFFLYYFINIAMVMGLIPVVGVPLPLISYGGTSMLTAMIGFALILNIGVHRDARMTKRGAIF